MSKKDMDILIKSWQDFETELDLLIIEQKISITQLRKDQEELRDKSIK